MPRASMVTMMTGHLSFMPFVMSWDGMKNEERFQIPGIGWQSCLRPFKACWWLGDTEILYNLDDLYDLEIPGLSVFYFLRACKAARWNKFRDPPRCWNLQGDVQHLLALLASLSNVLVLSITAYHQRMGVSQGLCCQWKTSLVQPSKIWHEIVQKRNSAADWRCTSLSVVDMKHIGKHWTANHNRLIKSSPSAFLGFASMLTRSIQVSVPRIYRWWVEYQQPGQQRCDIFKRFKFKPYFLDLSLFI